MTKPGITLYGTNWCADCKRSKQFFADQRVPYRFVDVDTNAGGLAVVEKANGGKSIIPTIRFSDGSFLAEPTNADLAKKLGLVTSAKRSMYDLIVIGSGPAGLTAALYAAREGLECLVIERGGIGGQVGITERLDNFPGVPGGIAGEEFANRLREQAERFGVEILSAQDVTRIEVDDDQRLVHTADGATHRAWAILLAVGSTYRRLGIDGEDDFIGSGVHYCATCDGPFYRGKDVLVIGGGNSAAEGGLFLTKFARHVTIVTRGPEFQASKVIIQKIERHPHIDVLHNVEPTAFKGKAHLDSVVLHDTTSKKERTIKPDGVFVFVGLEPNTGFLKKLVDLDKDGFIVTRSNLETSVAGIFAAGDCRAGSTAQAASAAGEGAAVALAIRGYIEPLAQGTSVKARKPKKRAAS